MFVDEVSIILKAGHGGAGKVSFFPFMGGPDGGNGGRGGDVYLSSTSDLFALGRFTHKNLWQATDGLMGRSNTKTGADGKDIEVIFPQGSILVETTTGETIEISAETKRLLICRGGKGGMGNHDLKSARDTTPKHAQLGLPGEAKEFSVVLKLIADFGLIGLPNAGKTSLLNELTKADAKVGNYPFTTLEPNLGICEHKVIADIPGLIEGASQGKGLGDKFLKHIEKVAVLFHCISSDSVDIAKDYQTIRNELEKFNPELLTKKEIILLTKTDLTENSKKQIAILKKFNPEIIPINILDEEALIKIRNIISLS